MIMGNNKHKNNKTQDNKKQQNQNQNANRERKNREEFAEEVDFSRIQNEKNKKLMWNCPPIFTFNKMCIGAFLRFLKVQKTRNRPG